MTTNNNIAGGKEMENNNYMHKATIQEIIKRIDLNLDDLTKTVDSMREDINQLKIESEKRKAFKSFFYSKEFIIIALLTIGAITGSNDLVKTLLGSLFS